MAIDFHREMDRYLTGKRRKRQFSNIKSKIMNKRAVVSYKAANKFGELKGRLTSKVEEIKKKREEPKREITQTDIDELVERKGIERPLREKMDVIGEGEGWKEIKLGDLEERKEDLTGLGEEKRKIQESLAKIKEKEREEKWKIAKLSEENEQREKAESEEDKIKRLELEEEVRILKEKQKIEEDRLAELRKARRREQMEALRGRVSDILFKKRPKKEKDMIEEVRNEIRMEARIEEAERQRAETKEREKPKEEVAKAEERPKEDVAKVEEELKESKKEVPEDREVGKEEDKLKKSFFSNFIQIRTAAEIAREEEERLKREEEQALRDQSEISKVFQEEGVEVRTNMPEEEQEVDLSTLFPGEEETEQKQVQDSENVIELDKGYKIRVVKNE